MWQLHPVAHATRLDVPLNLPLKLWTPLIFPLGKERLNQKAHSFIFPDKLKPTNPSFTKSKAPKCHPLSPSECYKSRPSLSHGGPKPPVVKWKSNWDVNKGAGFRVVSAKLIFLSARVTFSLWQDTMFYTPLHCHNIRFPDLAAVLCFRNGFLLLIHLLSEINIETVYI